MYWTNPARVIALVIGGFYVLVGLWAFLDPASFYSLVATFQPSNLHFLHDAGAFQVGLGLALTVPAALQVPLRAPLIAIAPLLTIVLGFGPTTIVVMAVLISFFPALVAGSAGLPAPSSEALALMRVLDAPERVRYLRLRIPAALPFVFAAFKITAPAAVLAAMVAEWTAANSGLGYLIIDAGEQYRFPLMWAGIVAATALAVGAFIAASFAERRVIWWPLDNA